MFILPGVVKPQLNMKVKPTIKLEVVHRNSEAKYFCLAPVGNVPCCLVRYLTRYFFAKNLVSQIIL